MGSNRGAPNAQGIHRQDQGRSTGLPRQTAGPIIPCPSHTVTSNLPMDVSVCPRVRWAKPTARPAGEFRGAWSQTTKEHAVCSMGPGANAVSGGGTQSGKASRKRPCSSKP